MIRRDALADFDARPRVLHRLYRALDAVDVAGDRTEARMLRRLDNVAG